MLARVVRFHQHDVHLGLIALCPQEDDASVARVIELSQDEVGLVLAHFTRRDDAADVPTGDVDVGLLRGLMDVGGVFAVEDLLQWHIDQVETECVEQSVIGTIVCIIIVASSWRMS